MPVPPATLREPKSVVVPWVAAGATKPVNVMAAAILKVTIVVFETLSESVAVTVSYFVPCVTELETEMTPVVVSMEKNEVRFVIE